MRQDVTAKTMPCLIHFKQNEPNRKEIDLFETGTLSLFAYLYSKVYKINYRIHNCKIISKSKIL